MITKLNKYAADLEELVGLLLSEFSEDDEGYYFNGNEIDTELGELFYTLEDLLASGEGLDTLELGEFIDNDDLDNLEADID